MGERERERERERKRERERIVHSTCTSYVLYAYLYCVYALVGGAISIRDPYICAVHESVPTNRTLSSIGTLSVE